ncbi:MAG: PKD domain-containing protein, partial [Bacteroidia bacterium]|nr:PKD domain-containing protein [Bacteroidia bacterium]
MGAIQWSTRLGTQANIACLALTAFLVDQCKNLYISGWGGTLASGNVSGLPTTPDGVAMFPTVTNYNDAFYVGVLETDAQSLVFGAYIGDDFANDHVDGGTSRFDKRGIVYQSACGSCGGQDDFPTTAGAYSSFNGSSNCNNVLFKIALEVIDPVIANFTYTMESDCDSIYITFNNLSENATSYLWRFGDGTTSTVQNPVHAYSVSGIYNVTLVAYNTGLCASSDSITVPINAQFGGPLYDFFTANAATYIGNDCFRLTQAVNNQRGVVWYGSPINLTQPFDYTFRVNLGTLDGNGADGIAFVLQQQGTTNQGTTGQGIGYGGMAPPNLAIEIDTWNNGGGDIACDHVAVHLNGQNTVPVAGPVQALPSNCNIEDGAFHEFRIVWNPVSQTFSIFMDGFLILTYTNDVVNNVFGGNPEVYWGFTAATGGAVNVHQVCMPDVPPVQYAPPVAIDATNVTCNGFRANWLPAPGAQRYYIDVSTDPAFGSFVGPYNQFDVGFDLFRDVTGLVSGTTYYYRVYSTSPCGLEGPSNVIAVNLPVVQVQASGDERVCVGDPIRLFAAGPAGAAYLWTGPNGFSSSAQTPVVGAASTANAGVYSVRAIAAGCTSEVASVTVAVQPPPPLQISAPASICAGQSATLTAVGSEGFVFWLPNNLNTGSITVSPSSTTSYTAVAYQPIGSSIIVNGDFEQGNIGFLSDYLYFSSPPLAEGRYAVTNNPQSVHAGFAPCSDHTSATGNMMVVNGNTEPNAVVWQQTITVVPGRNYLFSAWLQSLGSVNPAKLRFSVEGQQISDVLVAPGVTCQWINFSAVWFSGSSTTVVLSIVNQNTAAPGNDFAIDDISFIPVCQTAVVHNLVVNPQPDVVAYAEPAQLCDGEPTTLSAGGAETFVWSGPGLNAEPGPVVTFVPPLGTNVYTVVGTSSGGCTDETTVEVAVFALPAFDLTASPASICPGESSTLIVSPSQDVSVFYSPPGVFLPTGEYSFVVTPETTTVYTVGVFTPELNCSSERTITVQVRQTTEAAIDPIPNFCPEAAPYALSGVPSGGTFSGPGVIGGVFRPSLAGSGSHVVRYEGFENGCYFVDSATVTVYPAPVANIVGLANLYCTGQLCVQLTGVPPGGTFSGPGISTGNRFCPATAGVGFHSIRYSGFDANGCFYSVTRQTEVRQTPVASISGHEPTYCRSAAPDSWTGTPPGGQFLGPGMVDNVFYPNLANVGPNTIVYRGISNGCQYQTSVTVVVNQTPLGQILGLAPRYCTGDLCVAISGVPAGGTMSGPGVSTDGARFCPAAAGPGTHVISYSGEVNGCAYSTTYTLIVSLSPTAQIEGLQPGYCFTAGCQTLTLFPPGGTLLGPGVVDNAFCPHLAGAGEHVLRYTGQTDGCAYNIFRTVTVRPQIFPVIDAPARVCQNSPPVELRAFPSGGIFVGPGVTDGYFYPDQLLPGRYIIEYQIPDNECLYVASFEIAVDAVPEALIYGVNPAYCVTDEPTAMLAFPVGGTFSGPGVSGNL